MKRFRNNIYLITLVQSFFIINTVYGQKVADTNIFMKYGEIDIVSNDSVSFPNYFEYQKQIDSIELLYDNSQLRYLAIEKFQLKKYKLNIKIDSTSRIVKLNNGKEFKIIPTPSSIDAGYSFVKEFKQRNLLLFWDQWDEGGCYLLLNAKTGDTTYTIGKVYFSKSAKLMISINDDIEARYSGNGFQLFMVGRNNSLKEIWKYDPDWAPENIKWINDKTLMVQGYYFSEENGDKKIIFKKIELHLHLPIN